MTDETTTVLRTVSTSDAPSTADGPSYLSARDLSAKGHEGPIFGGVSVDAERGQLVAIVGQGGTGRTSLLLTLTGRFKHSGGTVTVDGQSEPKRVRDHAAIASAGPAVEPDEFLSVGALTSERLLIGGAEITPASVVEACGLFGIKPDSGTPYGHLDAPTKILFALALAAAEHRPIIAIDDVGHGLDRPNAHRVWSALRTLANHGHLVIATTAQPDIADVTVHLPARATDLTRVEPRVAPAPLRHTGAHRAEARQESTVDAPDDPTPATPSTVDEEDGTR